MQAKRGQSVAEYGLISGMVILAVIAALMLLGGNLYALFGNVLSALSLPPSNPVVAQAVAAEGSSSGANPSGNTSATEESTSGTTAEASTGAAAEPASQTTANEPAPEATSATPTAPAPTHQEIAVTVDASGRIRFTNMNDNSASLDTTGGEGTLLALRALQQTLTESNFSPTDPNLSDAFSAYNAAVKQLSAKMDAVDAGKASAINSAYGSFYTAHHQLQQALSQYPGYAGVSEQVDNVSGTIYQISRTDYFEPMIGKVSGATYSALEDARVGTNVATTPVTLQIPQ